MTRVSKVTIERLNNICITKIEEANDLGILDIGALVRNRRILSYDAEINYLCDLFDLLQDSKKISNPEKFKDKILEGYKKINGLFCKETI